MLCACVCMLLVSGPALQQVIKADISFCPTDDPYYYDLADRAEKLTLEEELLFETERERGYTDLSQKAWLRAQRRTSSTWRCFATPSEEDDLNWPPPIDVAFLTPWGEILGDAR